MPITTREVSLPGEGRMLPAYLALPEGPGPHPGMLVIEEIFGVNEHIQDVCRRLARAGYAAIAPELFYREKEPQTPYTDFQSGIQKKARLYDDKVVEGMKAAVDHLKGLKEVDGQRIGVIGFCMGGRMSYLAACRLKGLKAAVVFYGGGIVSDILNEHTPVAPVSLTGNISCAVLGNFAEEDHAIPLEHVQEIEHALRSHGKVFDIKVYPRCPHGFFCEARESYRPEAAKDAWERTLAFLEKYLSPFQQPLRRSRPGIGADA